jgi:hypothetical protein
LPAIDGGQRNRNLRFLAGTIFGLAGSRILQGPLHNGSILTYGLGTAGAFFVLRNHAEGYSRRNSSTFGTFERPVTCWPSAVSADHNVAADSLRCSCVSLIMCTRGAYRLFCLTGFKRRLKFPDRRVARTTNRVEREAGARPTAIAFNLKPANMLDDQRRRYCPLVANALRPKPKKPTSPQQREPRSEHDWSGAAAVRVAA